MNYLKKIPRTLFANKQTLVALAMAVAATMTYNTFAAGNPATITVKSIVKGTTQQLPVPFEWKCWKRNGKKAPTRVVGNRILVQTAERARCMVFIRSTRFQESGRAYSLADPQIKYVDTRPGHHYDVTFLWVQAPGISR